MVCPRERDLYFNGYSALYSLACTKSEGFDLYPDHNNLVFTFDPLSVVKDISKNSVRKFLRCALGLYFYNCTCIHIKGTDNVWTDLLGRWYVSHAFFRLIHIYEMPSVSSKGFKWP